MHDLRTTLPNAVVDTKRFDNMLDNYVQPWNSELGKEVLLQHIRLLVPWYVNSVSSDLKTMGKPTLLVWGEQDHIVPIRYGQRLHHDIPGSTLVIVPSAGHMILFDAADAVANVLVNFTKGL